MPSVGDEIDVDALNARLDGGEGGAAASEGSPAGVAGLPEDVPDDIVYRDAKALREQVTAVRQKYQPWEQALAPLDEATQSRLLEAIPDLSPFTGLDAQDRKALGYFAQVYQSDPAAAVDWLRQSYEAMSGESLGAPPAPQQQGPPVDEFGLPVESEEDQPVTMRQLQEFMRAQEQEAMTRYYQEEIDRELRDLGYNANSTDPLERATANTVMNLAMEYGGDIAKAHEILNGMRQSAIDDYLKSKGQDAVRTAAAVPGGQTAVQERPLDNLAQAGEAADEYLAALFQGRSATGT